MILLNLDRRSKTPLFRQIFFQLRNLIDKNVVQTGDRLPSTRSLAHTLEVHRSTVVKAYEELWAYGYIQSKSGAYSTVRKKTELATFEKRADKSALSWEKITTPPAETMYRYFTDTKSQLSQAAPTDIINFATLDLDSRLFPLDAFRKCMNRVFTNKGATILKYGESEGYRPLRNYIAQRLQIHGISISWDEILITNGAQHGFDLLMKLMAAPDRKIFVECPTYALALPLLHYYQTDVVGIPMEETGMSLVHLEKALKKEPPAFIYTMPNFQNPTGITMTQEHREALLSLCETYRIPLVEDAFEEEMKYFGKVPPPIKSMDRQQIVIYLGTFSKVLFPGIRMGWVAANKSCIDRLTALKRHSDLSSSMPIQAALTEFCQLGHYDHHIKRMHRIFRKRMQIMTGAMRTHLTHEKVHWTEPAGGYLIWIQLDGLQKNEEELSQIFLKNGVRLMPGQLSFPKKTAQEHFRLSISTLNEEEIVEGIRRMRKAISQIYDA